MYLDFSAKGLLQSLDVGERVGMGMRQKCVIFAGPKLSEVDGANFNIIRSRFSSFTHPEQLRELLISTQHGQIPFPLSSHLSPLDPSDSTKPPQEAEWLPNFPYLPRSFLWDEGSWN